MAGKPKPQEEEGGESAPLWIISFADMISLLMAFFVMLSTFSSFGPKESEKVRAVARLIVTPNYGWHSRTPQSAVAPTLMSAGDGATGSERPTLETKSNNKGMKEGHSPDFKTARVFTAESSAMFLGQGQTLSPKGQEVLESLALYLQKIPGQIVIYVKGADGRGASQPGESEELSIARSVMVLNYLENKGIPKERCTVSSESMLEGQTIGGNGRLEIVLADELQTGKPE
jgi:flagellar motor protein MotB